MNLPTERIKDFTKNELLDLWELAEKCINSVSNASIKAVYDYVRNFFSYEYGLCALLDVTPNNNASIIEVINNSYPNEWVDIYLKKSFQHIDPVLKKHISSFKPQIWSQTYNNDSCLNSEFITISHEFGLCNGATHGIKEMICPRSSIFSFSGIDHKEIQRVLSVLDLIIPHMHVAVQNNYRIKNRQKLIGETLLDIKLSDREKEVLNWLKIGKTNWEISMIMSISERTAKFHVANIQKKLNSSTRGYAVAKAIQLELISL